MANKYERVADDLRSLIASGSIKPGEQLPKTEAALAKEYDVSIPTLREALRLLKRESLIESRQGIGWFVRAPRQKVTRSPERYQWEKDRVRTSETERLSTGATERDTGLTFTDLQFSAEYRTTKATATLAEDFGIPVGTKMLERIYRTKSKREDVPINLTTSYLVYRTLSQNPALLNAKNEPWPGGTQHQLSTIGIEIAEIVDEITTRPPTADEADQLGIDVEGVSVFVHKKISYDTSGSVVELSFVILPGDRTMFRYSTKLTLWESK